MRNNKNFNNVAGITDIGSVILFSCELNSAMTSMPAMLDNDTFSCQWVHTYLGAHVPSEFQLAFGRPINPSAFANFFAGCEAGSRCDSTPKQRAQQVEFKASVAATQDPAELMQDPAERLQVARHQETCSHSRN